jgi:hypothetical protein
LDQYPAIFDRYDNTECELEKLRHVCVYVGRNERQKKVKTEHERKISLESFVFEVGEVKIFSHTNTRAC